MKHNKLVLGFAAVVAAAMLFSCSTGDGLTIEKRRYRDGFYVAKNHKKSANTEEKQVAVERPTITPAQASGVTQKAVTPESVKGEVQTIAGQTPAPKAATVAASPAKNTVTPSVVTAPLTKKEVRQAAKEVVKQGTKKSNKSFPDDVPEAVIIICCIFIPPLGVYFVKGDIDNDFWINLVLSILCWIPGVIHALIIYSRNK